MAGWPLLFLRVPPYQDLPDHLATLCVLLHPERYPELSASGWLKSNVAFFALLLGIARWAGPIGAGRIVCALVVAATALSLPHFVLEFTDRRRLLVGSLVMAPLVHGWFVLMGMLAFSLAVPLALWMLVLLHRQAARATPGKAAGVAALAIGLWACHAIVLLLVVLLAVVEALRQPTWRARIRSAGALVTPLAPVALLVGVTIARQAVSMSGGARWGRLDPVGYESNASLVYTLWAHAFYALSPRSAGGLLPAVALAIWGARGARRQVPLLSTYALAALGALYVFLPHTLPGFGYVNERVLPFLWAWALVRVPPRCARGWAIAVGLGSAAWAAGLAMDLFRAEGDLDQFVAAAPAVPRGARLLTLNFMPRVTSRNTWSLLHASGLYTVLRDVAPQDAWADSAAMPFSHRRPPAFVEDGVAVRGFLQAASSPAVYCSSLSRAGLPPGDCADRWKRVWQRFWDAAAPRYDYVLLWGAPPAVAEGLPRPFVRRLTRGRLALFAKADVPTLAP